MTEGRDLAAIEAAELRALRAEADRRREELGQTIEALRKKIAESVGVRHLAEVAAEWAAAHIRRAAGHAIRSAVPATRAAAATTVRRATATRGRRAAVIGVPAGAAALAAGWFALRRVRRSGR